MKKIKKQANTLIEWYLKYTTYDSAKKCAIHHCGGIIEERLDHRKEANTPNNERIKFWQDVQKDIEARA